MPAMQANAWSWASFREERRISIPAAARAVQAVSACDDNNACTQSDTCQAGVCTGANPVCNCGNVVNTLNRPSDPVVMNGSNLVPMQGVAPADLVAFQYSEKAERKILSCGFW